MKVSQLFSKTEKNDPKGEVSQNAKLLIRAGFVDKLSAGIYSYLPLGLKVIKKIENIVKEEMDSIGGQELLLPAMHLKDNWEKTGRWGVDEMFKIEGGKLGLGWTHEEIITPLALKYLKTEKDFPKYLYQIQTKYRNEPRAKSGVLRGREFIMKDMYSFHLSEEDLDTYYEEVKKAYFKIYERCGLKDQTFLVLSGGGEFTSKYSHEFQTVTSAGEDQVFVCKKCKSAFNKEIFEDKCLECGSVEFEEKKAIEVGNIFKLGTKYSEVFDFKVDNKNIIMGCYGIGISRLMGAIVEVFNDEKGILWPKEVTPYDIYLIDINSQEESEKVYKALQYKGYDVLFDDRDKKAGEKFADADLIGTPLRIVVSEKTLSEDSVEIKKRKDSDGELVKLRDIVKYLKEKY